MDGNIVAQLFPGIASLMVQDTTIAIARYADRYHYFNYL